MSTQIDAKFIQKYEAEVQKYNEIVKKLQNIMAPRARILSQLHECELVKKELDELEPDAVVYKLIGPVLVKQDLADCKNNVNERINRFKSQM